MADAKTEKQKVKEITDKLELSDGFTYPHLLLESPARKAVLLKRCG